MEIALAVVVALLVVGTGAVLLRESRRAAATRDAASTPAEPARLDEAEVNRIVSLLRSELSTSQAAALQANSEQFLTLAEQRLGREAAAGEEQLKARQGAIDKGLEDVRTRLREMTKFVRETDEQRQKDTTRLETVMDESRLSVKDLSEVTQDLHQALSSGQQRGQWGERMADDILRAAGLREGINYTRNTTIIDVDGARARPDFTFMLPQDLSLHMDVKFPLDNYTRYRNADNDAERDAACKQFLSDVRARFKEVVKRGYIDPTSGTLDFVIVFIPNEQVYSFIHEHDPTLLDDALKMRVIPCSPITLFAVLAVIRQSVENFHLSKQTNQILEVLGTFTDQWEKYGETVENLGRRLDLTQKAYTELSNARTNQLQRQMDRVEALRAEANIGAVSPHELQEQPEFPVQILDDSRID